MTWAHHRPLSLNLFICQKEILDKSTFKISSLGNLDSGGFGLLFGSVGLSYAVSSAE